MRVKDLSIEHLAGICLVAAEAVSYEIKRPVLEMADVTELILVGGFHGIDKFYTMGNGELRRGLIAYLRSAVFASHAALRLESDVHFGKLRDESLFAAGSYLKTRNIFYFLQYSYPNYSKIRDF